MVLDPNWGTNLFRTYQDARRGRLQEAEAVDERELRGLQRQQIQTGMARQQEQDAADAELANYVGQAPLAPPRPTKTPPDALAGGMPPGIKVAPSLRTRPGAREAIPAAIEAAAVQELSKRPDFAALVAGGAPVDPGLQSRLLKSSYGKQAGLGMITSEQERARNAPLNAFNLGEEYDNRRHTWKHQEDTLSETRRSRQATSAYQNATLTETSRQNKLEDALRTARDAREQGEYEQRINGPGLLKMGKEAAGAVGGKMLDVAGNVISGLMVKAPMAAAKNATQERIAAARINQAGESLKQKESQFTRHLAAMQAESDTGRVQQMARDAYRLQGEMDRDRAFLNRMRESAMYRDGDADPAAALGQEGGPSVERPGWFGSTQQPTAPIPKAPTPPPAASVLQVQARAAVAQMTPAQKAAEKARLRALRGN